MEIERNEPRPSLGTKMPLEKPRSSTRMRYEAEVGFLKKQNGNLDQIREKLGLSRRQICQLLLVDPSAWTRWTSPGGEAPPHIYRALDWYLSILEKDPEYRRLSHRFGEWLAQEKNVEGRLRKLEAQIGSKTTPNIDEKPTFLLGIPLWKWTSWSLAALGLGFLLLALLKR